MPNSTLTAAYIKSKVLDPWLKFGANREIRRLHLYLTEGEDILAIITGSRLHERGRGIIVATSDRVIFAWDGWVFRENQDFPYETISSVEFNTSIFFGVFILYGKGDEIAYNWVGRSSGAKFAKIIREKVMERKRQEVAYHNTVNSQILQTPNTTSTPTPPTKEERLQELELIFHKGNITEEEYHIARASIINN